MLDLAALLDELDKGPLLSDVLEVCRDHGVQGLLHQFLDVTEPLDDTGRLPVIDVDHHGKREGGFEGILGDEVNSHEVLVELVTSHLVVHPLQHDIRGGDRDHLPCEGIEGVLTREKGLAPDPFAGDGDQFPVLVIMARGVGTLGPDVGDNHASIPHRDDGLGDSFHGGEETIDVIGTFHDDLVLPSTQTTCLQERLWILEVVVVHCGLLRIVPHRGCDDVPRFQGGTVVYRHDPDPVVRPMDDHRSKASPFPKEL